MPDIKSTTMKLNGPQPPISASETARPQKDTGLSANSKRPAGDALQTVSARQQLAELKLAEQESVLARVAEILRQKDGSYELLLELRGSNLKVAAGQQMPDLATGDLLKLVRAGDSLQLAGKLLASPESAVARALAQRLPWQQNLQSGLAQLLNALETGLRPSPRPGQLPSSVPALPLPTAARDALQNLTQHLPTASALEPGVGKSDTTAARVQQWLSHSGTFAEANLLQHKPVDLTRLPDLKHTLARVVSALLASENLGPEQFNRLTPLASPDLMQAPLQFPRPGTQASPQAGNETGTVGQTLRLLAGMLNRITVNQLHSQTLNARTGAEPGAPVNTLLVELPWLTPQNEPRTAQLRLEEYRQEQDKTGQAAQANASEWRLSLSMDLDEAGPIHFDVTFRHPSVSAMIWADRQSTLRKVNEELPLLRKSLQELGLDIGELDCRRGLPRQTETRLEHRLVDTKA